MPHSNVCDLSQVAGVDEVGRGPLAGPVTAAAVILDPLSPIEGLRDSKRLSHNQRVVFANQIKRQALAYSIAHASVAEIDKLNILRASLLAMQRAIERLAIVPELALIDGNQLPDVPCAAISIIKGCLLYTSPSPRDS